MERNAFIPKPEEVKNFVLAALVLTAGYVAMQRTYTPRMILIGLLVSVTVLGARELGQRIVAHLMHAYVELELSTSGVVITVLGAMVAVLVDLPFALLFPIYSIFNNKQYESWGYSIDVIWIKREYWMAATGLLFVFIAWGITYYFEFFEAARMMALFIFFQMMPFRENIVEGELDGVKMILYSGFYWLIFIGASIMAFVLPV